MTDRQFTEDKLVIATHNVGKMREIEALFASFDFTILSAKGLGLAEPAETEDSFVGNAVLKAKAQHLHRVRQRWPTTLVYQLLH